MKPPTLWYDNIGAKTKYNGVEFNFVRERVQKKELLVKYISSLDQSTDILTKSLGAPSFSCFFNNFQIFFQSFINVFFLRILVFGQTNSIGATATIPKVNV